MPKRRPHPTVENGGQDLVWRTPTVNTPATFMGVEGAHSIRTPDAHSASVDPASVAVTMDSAPHRERDALRSIALDPAVADRLAEDVIRRVERRIRIERERRGI